MATRTTLLNLIKPAYEDAADIAVLNSNMDALDANASCPLLNWVASKTYKIGDIRVKDKKIWQCKTANSDATFDKDKWDNIGGGGDGANIGDIKWSSSDLTQVGFLVANGAEVGRATYPDLDELYSAMGYPWGDGDGSTTFNLPNLIGKFAEGATSAGGYHDAGLPNIDGEFQIRNNTVWLNTFRGALLSQENAINNAFTNGTGSEPNVVVSIDASKSNAIYGNSTTVQPNSALLIPYVKAFKGASADSTDVAITNVANDCANKANRDLSNLTEKGKAFSFPSATKVTIPSVVNGTEYTAPANGYLVSYAQSTTIPAYIAIVTYNGGNACIQSVVYASGTSQSIYTYVPLQKGQKGTIYLSFANNLSTYFVYAEGEV